MAETVKITIDGTDYDVPAGKNVLQAILDAGHVLPHFCYHEALGAVGSCRLCAAMVAPGADKPGRLDMTCMCRVVEGMVVTVNDPYAKGFRKQVIEDLMLNHPHDCPVCDEGGECMLQDMTVLSEHQHRRNRFKKRTWRNQYLGPGIHHEMNRCITCYRCVRYYRDYALGEDLGVYGSRDRVYFGRVEDGTLQSEFAGNLLDVCPTGVFTNKRFRENYARPWDLLTVKSVCPSCSVGCNVLPGFRHTTLRRVKPAENPAVNTWFLCDRGRFGGEFVNSAARLSAARIDGAAATLDSATTAAADRLKSIAAAHGGASVAVIGSDRASLETNGALALLAQALGGRSIMFADSATRAAVKRAAAVTAGGTVAVASLQDMEKADFVLVAGGDMTGEVPLIDLSIRQVIKAGLPYFELSPRAGSLTKFAKQSLRAAPGEVARLLTAVSANASGASDAGLNGAGGFVAAAGAALAAAKRPLIVASALHGDASLIDAAAALAGSITGEGRAATLAFALPGANSAGLGLLKKDADPDTFRADLAAGKIKAVVVAERDALADFGADAFAKCELVVVVDAFATATADAAHVLLPCVSHYQSFGTFVNYEGRGQRFEGMQLPLPATLAASEVLVGLVQAAAGDEALAKAEFHDLFDVTAESSAALDALKPNGPGARVKLGSVLAATTAQPASAATGKSPAGFVRWNTVHTFGGEELSAMSPPVAEMAPRPAVELHPDDAARLGLSEGDHVDSAKGLGAEGRVVLNAGLAPGVVAVPRLATVPQPGLAAVATPAEATPKA